MEIPPISPLRPGSVYFPYGQSPPAGSETSTQKRDRLKEYIEFWKNEGKNWTPPSEFVTNVNQVFCLRNIRHLSQNSVCGLNKLFQDHVDYRVEIVDLPTEPNMYIAWCKWPGRTEWIAEEGRSASVAMTNVSVKALKIVLGDRFEKYCTILASKIYTGKTEEELEKLFRSEILKEGTSFLHQPLAASGGESRMKSKEHSKERYFDKSPLGWTEKRWKKLSKDNMEDALFQFWNQAPHGQKFPWTMNLFWVRYGTDIEATPAFMLLFSDGRKIRKPGVSWIDLKPKGRRSPIFRVKLMWTDENEKMHGVSGSGSTLILARNDAAKAALKKIFSKTDLKILEYAHSNFVYDGIKRNGIDLHSLWDKLMEAKRSELLNANVIEDANRTGANQTERNLLSKHTQNASIPADQTNAPEFVVGLNYLPASAPRISSNFNSSVGAYMASLSCGPVNPSLSAPLQVSSSGQSPWISIPSRPLQPPSTVTRANTREAPRLAPAGADLSGGTRTPLASVASESHSTSNSNTRPLVSIPIMQGSRQKTSLPKPIMLNELQTPDRVGATSACTPEQSEPRPLLPLSAVSNSSLPVAQSSIVPVITTPTLSAPTTRLLHAAPSLTLSASLVTSTNQSALTAQISQTAPPSPDQASLIDLAAESDTEVETQPSEPDAVTTPLSHESSNAALKELSSVTSTNQSALATQISPTAPPSPASVVDLAAESDTEDETQPSEPDAVTRPLSHESPYATLKELLSVTCTNQSVLVTQICPTAPPSPARTSVIDLAAESDTDDENESIEPDAVPTLMDHESPNATLKELLSVNSTNRSALATPTSQTAPPSPAQASVIDLTAESDSKVETQSSEPDAVTTPLSLESPNAALKELSAVTSTNQSALATPTSLAAPPSPAQASVIDLTALSDTEVETEPSEPDAVTSPLYHESPNAALKELSTATTTDKCTPASQVSPTAPPSPAQASVIDFTAHSDNEVETQSSEPDAAPTPLAHESPNAALKELSAVTSTNQSALATPTSLAAPPSPFQSSIPALLAQNVTTSQNGEPDATPVRPDESPNPTPKASSSVASANQPSLATPTSPNPVAAKPQSSAPVLPAQSDTTTEPDQPYEPLVSAHQSAPTIPTSQILSPAQFSVPVQTAPKDTTTHSRELDAAPLPNDSPNPALKTSSSVASTNQSVLETPTIPAAPPSPPQASAPVLTTQSATSIQPDEPVASPSFTLSDTSVTSTHQPTPAAHIPPMAAPPTPQASVPLPTAQSDTSTQPGEPNLDEYFSTSDDGSVAVSDWLLGYLKTAHTRSMDQYRYSEEKDDPSQRIERQFLPFHKIIGYEYPQEASLALDELFEDAKEPSPVFATTKLVLAEVQVNGKTFQGLGSTMEEAKETAAKAALEYLQSQSDAVSDEDVVLIDS